MPVLTWTEMKEERQRLKEQGKKVVFTNGCFDILHPGHAQYLMEAKKQGDVLIVGLNSDASVCGLKGPERPIVPESDRAFMLDALKAVDYVVLFDEETPLSLIETLLPDVMTKGGDYNIENIVGADVVKAAGGEVYSLCHVDGASTTSIVERIKSLV